jgi:Glycosyltransferase like family 2
LMKLNGNNIPPTEIECDRPGSNFTGIRRRSCRTLDVSHINGFTDMFTRSRADPVHYLAGGNMSFRRSALRELGGFDERYIYGYEDVDLCCRLIDAEMRTAIAPDALVYHYPASNIVRDSHGIYRDLYPFIQSRIIFCLSGTTDPIREQEAMERLDACVLNWRHVADHYLSQGIFDPLKHNLFVRRLSDAIADGIALAKLPPRIRKFWPADDSEFQPFPVFSSGP